jgi:DNA-binding transcriptional MerR regulator
VQESEWSIGEVARRAGLKRSAIRYYEQIGLLPKAERVGGQRRYDTSVLTLLSIIDVAQRAGFTLAETRTLLEGFAPQGASLGAVGGARQTEALRRRRLDRTRQRNEASTPRGARVRLSEPRGVRLSVRS